MDPRYPIGKFTSPQDITPALRTQAIDTIAELPAKFRAAVSPAQPLPIITTFCMQRSPLFDSLARPRDTAAPDCSTARFPHCCNGVL